jgi:hypothetical protein
VAPENIERRRTFVLGLARLKSTSQASPGKVGYDRLGVIGIVAMLVQATGAPPFSAACSGGSLVSHARQESADR